MGCSCQKTPTEQDVKKIAELDQYIDSLLAGTSDERRSGFLIQILHRAQSLFGFLSEETQKHVSEKLRIPVAEIYGVISFYSYFTDKPVGRYKINVCTGTACFVKGAAKVLEEFKRNLGIQEGETTGDGRFFLGGLRCVGACSLAPVVMVNDRVYGNVTAEKVAEILAECKE